MMKRIAEASPSLKARIAGGLFLLLILTAAFTEFFVHGRLGFAADLAVGIIEVSGMIAVTLLFYDIFRAVNRRLSLLAASFNFVALTFELLRFTPRGVNIGMGFHGFYCFLIGYLIFRSTFLPRILGALMAFAGLCWLTFLSPTLAALSVSLQSGLRPPRGRFGVAVAPRDGRERSTMEGAGQRMKAAYTRYGPPDVVEVNDLDKPVPRDNEVLIKVRAASVNPLDWKTMTGGPYIVRLLLGLRKPKIKQLGVDVAGQVEAVGRNVTQFKPGDAVFGTCRGAFAEYACTCQSAKLMKSALVMKPNNVTFEQAACCTCCGAHRVAGSSRQGADSAGTEGLDQWRRGRRGYVRRADRQVVRHRCHRRMQYQECGHGPIHRRRSSHRLHTGGFHQERATLRPAFRRVGNHLSISMQGRAQSQRDINHGRSTKRRSS